MKNNHVNNYLLGIIGIFLGIVLTCAVIIPQAVQINNWTNSKVLETAVQYWESQGYVAYADPSGTLHVNSIEPNADDTYDIGTAILRFQKIYGMDVYVDGMLYAASANVSGIIYQGGFAVPQAPGAPDYVVGVNTATDDVPGSTGYWVKSGSTGQVVETTTSTGDVAINWAITALPVAGGKVQLTGGTFNIGATINLNKDYGAIIGEGYATLLQLVNNANCNLMTISAGSTLLADMRFLGNKANQTSGSCLLIYGISGYLRNLNIYGFKEYGVWVSAGSNVHGDGLYVGGCDGDGFLIANAGANQFSNCWSGTNGGRGFHILSTESYFSHIVSDQNGAEGIDLESLTHSQLTEFVSFNNLADDLFLHGVYRCVIANGNIGTAGATHKTGGQWSCLRISYTTNSTISNLTLYGMTDIATTRGIFWEAGVQNNVFQGIIIQSRDVDMAFYSWSAPAPISGNIITDCQLLGTTKIAWGGGVETNVLSQNKFKDNLGYVTENSGTDNISSGSTSRVITHGCSYTPALADITIIFSNNSTNALGNWWVDTITATQFTVHVANDPGASHCYFSWSVRKN